METKEKTAKEIIQKARQFGAHLVGFVDVEDLFGSPSVFLYEGLESWAGVGSTQVKGNLKDDKNLDKRAEYKFQLPKDLKTVVVIAMRHPRKEPVLDWYYQEARPGGTLGNFFMIQVFDKLSKWLEREKGIKTAKIPYAIELGGIFIKDAAVWAGIGVLGKNNMLVTPEYGPRVRLRALGLDVGLGSTGMLDFDPCNGCTMPCRTVCPEESFNEKIYNRETWGMDTLPAREGVYSRERCNVEMVRNVDNADLVPLGKDKGQKKIKQVHYCRMCEFACPVGKGK